MDTATLYRDPNYGAAAVIVDGATIEVVNHDSVDFSLLHNVLEAQARLEAEEGGVQKWVPFVHRDIVLANIDRAMRDVGYTEDRLGDRAIFMDVSEEMARSPDLPADGNCRVSEAVERAMSAQLSTALALVGLPATVETAIFTPYPRPNAKAKRTLPFFVARARTEAGVTLDTADTCERWRKALEPFGPALVRATVWEDEGRVVLEAAIRLPEEAMIAFESAALPAFEQHPLMGQREAHIHITKTMVEADLEKIRDRAAACTAATTVEMMDGEPGVLRVLVPSTIEGDHLADPAFRERVTWLVQETEDWEGTLEWVGQMDTPQEPVPVLDERVDKRRWEKLSDLRDGYAIWRHRKTRSVVALTKNEEPVTGRYSFRLITGPRKKDIVFHGVFGNGTGAFGAKRGFNVNQLLGQIGRGTLDPMTLKVKFA